MQGETEDRRSPRARRVELETLVEICGKDPDVPAFEARSIEVSGRGMQVRTRHLPEVGAPLVLRFERDGNEVLVEGEVAWRSGDEHGGQFGVKFTALDSNSVSALKALCHAGAARADADSGDSDYEAEAEDDSAEHDDQQPYLSERGAAVKLHIQGLGAPMKARVFEGTPRKLKVGSQLEFLRVGRELELEDVTAGSRRAAEISTVSVAIDPESQIPQLVVSLRYEGVDDETPEPTVVADNRDDEHLDDEEDYDDEFTEDLFKGKVGAVAANAERAMKHTSKQVARWGANALAGLGNVVKSAKDRAERTPPKKQSTKSQKPLRRTSRASVAPAPRRRTSTMPAASGKGRRPQHSRQAPPPAPKRSSRWVIYGAAALCSVAGAYALFAERGHQADAFDAESMSAAAQVPLDSQASSYPEQASAGPAASTAGQVPNDTQAAPLPTGPTGLPARAPLDTQQQLQPDPRGIVAQVPLFGATPMATAEAAPLNPAPVTPTLDEYSMSKDQAFTDRIVSPPAAKSDDSEPESQEAATVFQVGRMDLPHIHRLRLDAPGTALQGSKTPSGFTVLIPGRKVMENGSAIASRDDRIVNVRVANTPAGSKVTFRFRKDVPGYKARLRNDYVEFFINSPKK